MGPGDSLGSARRFVVELVSMLLDEMFLVGSFGGYPIGNYIIILITRYTMTQRYQKSNVSRFPETSVPQIFPSNPILLHYISISSLSATRQRPPVPSSDISCSRI